MLALLTDKVSNNDTYVYEIKWDGYRIVAYKDHKGVVLRSRSLLNYNDKYPPVLDAVRSLKQSVILDGEVVVLNEHGLPDFDALQKYNGNDPLAYYIFDILYLDGKDLKDREFTERREILKSVIRPNDVLRISDYFEDGEKLFEQAKSAGLEGIVAKRKKSLYLPNDRSDNWLKMKIDIRQEYVIGGWTESESGHPFAALLFGYYSGKDFYYLGHSGGGFKDSEMGAIKKKLLKLEIKKKPFVNEVETDRLIHWVKPELVANIKFDTFTTSGKVRKPAIFQGFRDDKKAKDVQYEPPTQAHVIKQPKNFHLDSPTKSNWKLIAKEDTSKSGDFSIEGCDMTFYNVGRHIWKDVSKAHLIQYYDSISSYILPHLKDRPLSLHIKPINANADGFYIKDMEGHQPQCADIFPVERKHKEKGKRDIIDYLVCNNNATLLYCINLGCIDLNPWNSRTTTPDQPDYIVIDLDPTVKETEAVDFKKVIETSLAMKQYCDEKKIKAFCKTSGKTGMHFILPCMGFSYTQARSIAEAICSEVHKLVPKITTIENSIALRGTKLYLDPSQNDYADTIASAYSLRPWKLKTVSTPVEWKEITASLNPLNFTFETILKRLEKKGDVWANAHDNIHKKSNAKKLATYL